MPSSVKTNNARMITYSTDGTPYIEPRQTAQARGAATSNSSPLSMSCWLDCHRTVGGLGLLPEELELAGLDPSLPPGRHRQEVTIGASQASWHDRC
jgi:hypothetical protein